MEIFLIDNDVLVWLEKHFGLRAFEAMRDTKKVHVTRYIAKSEFAPRLGIIKDKGARDRVLRCKEIVKKLVVKKALDLENAEGTAGCLGHTERTIRWHEQLGGGDRNRNRGEATILALAEMLKEKGIEPIIVTNDHGARNIASVKQFQVINAREFAKMLRLIR